MYALGIDLGTTFTAAAVWRDGRAEISPLGSRSSAIPSVVVLREDGTVMTGEAANRRALSDPYRVAREFKRRLGDSTPLLLGGVPFSAEALMAKLLRAVVDEVSAREGGPPSAICVSHPANWGPYKTDLLQQAVRRADLEDATYCSEPVAAAVAYAHQERLPADAVVAVYDLGGGTFDAAVLRRTPGGFEILGRPEGIERLGGIDIDAAVFAHVARALGGVIERLDDEDPATVTAIARLRDECTQAKEALSSDTDTTIPVLLPELTTEVRLTRTELENMVRPALQDTIEALRRALRSAGVTPEDLHSVLLVGGSSRMPLVGRLVEGELGRPVAVDTHPKFAVSLGAARLAGGVEGGLEGGVEGAGQQATAVVPTVPLETAAPEVPAARTMMLPPVRDESQSQHPAAGLASASSGSALLPGEPLPAGGGESDGFEPPSTGRTPFPGSADGPPAKRRGRIIAVAAVAAVVIAAGATAAALHGGGGGSPGASPTPGASVTTTSTVGKGESAGAPGPLVVVAHRGGYETFAHETLPALVDAAKAGDLVQADVLWTADDVPIVLHETTTVTSSKADQGAPIVCTGGPYVVAKTKWIVLQANCRSLASLSKDGKQYPIPTLDEVTKAIAAVPGAEFSAEVSAERATKAQTEGMLKLIEKYGMVRRTSIGSFDPDILAQVHQQAVGEGLALRLMRYIRPDDADGSVPTAASLADDHLYGVTLRLNIADQTYVSSLKAAGLVVMAWTANTEAQWADLKKAGVVTVFTDLPGAYRTWLATTKT